MVETPEDPLQAMRTADGRDFGARRRQAYTHWIEEQRAWHETCTIGDWSFLANAVLAGPDARALLEERSVNTFAEFATGQGKHLIQCDADGHVVAEGVLVRRGESTFELHGTPAYWTAYQLETGDHDAEITFRETYNYQVQGPTAIHVLESVVEGPLRNIEFIHAGSVSIAGNAVTALRMGMAGEVGFELQGPAAEGPAVWAAVREAGAEHGIRELSARTSSINHLEACFPTRGRDYIPAVFGEEMADYRDWLAAHADRDLLRYPIEGSFDADTIEAWYRTPIELGWARNVALDHAFVGRSALEPMRADPDRTMVTLVWDDEAVIDSYASLFGEGPHRKYMEMPHQQKRAMIADRVERDGALVGTATCRGYSYHFREMLSLCTIDVEHAEPGTRVTVVWGEGAAPPSPTVETHEPARIGATVAPAPYKEDRRRTDLHSLPATDP